MMIMLLTLLLVSSDLSITITPALVNSYNPGQECYIVRGNLTKLVADVNTLMFLISCQKSH
jgi:hypothetical protein